MTSSADNQRAVSGADRGREADSPAQMPVLGWKEILLRTFKEGAKDNIALVAAGVAFYAFLAVVPLMGATVLTYGFIARPEAVLKDMQSLTAIAPPNISHMIGDMLLGVVKASGSKKGFGILIALGIALWGARNAAGSIMIALNIAYEEDERRGLVRKTLTALAMTLGLVLLGLAAITAMGVLQYVQQLWPGSSATAAHLGRIAIYPMLGVGAAATAATIYRYGPSRQKAKWSWLTPGSIFSAVGWLVTTVVFGLYVTRFADYNATYGSLGGAIALLTWIYLSSYVFLLGAELNSEVEHQTARDTTAGAEKPLGERGAWSADHVADGPADEGKEAETGKPSAMSSDAAEEGPRGKSNRCSAHFAAARKGEGDAHPYLVSRATSRVGSLTGLRTIGMMSSLLATAGLSLLRTRGKAKAGAGLLGAAAGLALLCRDRD
ncbi:MAG: YihY/virulence factor BrkB family protein [Sphingomicrobium sp.]